MGITITKNFGELAHAELITEDDMREVGLLAREIMVRRTMAGRDVDGGAFQPYSAAYAKAKRAALGTGAVNLQVSGAMLNDITIVDVHAWPDPFVVLGFTR